MLLLEAWVTTISKVAAGTEIWLSTHIRSEVNPAKLSNFPFIYMLSMIRTWPFRYVASIPEVAAGRGEKNSNNYEGAKQGLTARGRSCQSPRLGRLQQESPRISSGFPFPCSTQDVWIGGLGPLSVKRKTQYRGWHRKENKINKEVRLILPPFPIPRIWTASITYLHWYFAKKPTHVWISYTL